MSRVIGAAVEAARRARRSVGEPSTPRAPVGDSRDRGAVRAWAAEIAGVLAAEQPAAPQEPVARRWDERRVR